MSKPCGTAVGRPKAILLYTAIEHLKDSFKPICFIFTHVNEGVCTLELGVGDIFHYAVNVCVKGYIVILRRAVFVC